MWELMYILKEFVKCLQYAFIIFQMITGIWFTLSKKAYFTPTIKCPNIVGQPSNRSYFNVS